MKRTLFAISLLLLPASPGLAQSANLDRTVQKAENREAAIPRDDQDQTVADRLAELKQRTGMKPNRLGLVVNDMGYADPGCHGGGAAIGSAISLSNFAQRPLAFNGTINSLKVKLKSTNLDFSKHM
jgi:hypothetical protein